MSNKKLIDHVAKRMEDAIEQDTQRELCGLFPHTLPNIGGLSFDDLLKAIEPTRAWDLDREACLKEDREKNRGTLILNPEVAGAKKLEGDITKRDGIEYRIMIDENLRGMRDEDGSTRMGYWVDPLPPLDLTVPITVDADFGDKWANYSPNRYFQSLNYPPINRTIQGVGVDVVDLGPTPMDLVSAEMPKATVREQKRALVYGWKASRLGISLKEYARRSKWGRAWLERKRR